jgi:hypothetical protein
MELSNRKLRIDFQKLINNNWYLESDVLLIYQWLIRIGKICNKQDGWYRYGLHQSFHDYSYNNEPNKVIPLSSDWRAILHSGFVNLLCKTNHPEIVDTFLEKERIAIGSVRVIDIHESIPSRKYFKEKVGEWHNNTAAKLSYITTAYKGLELKKEKFHSDYEERVHPRIIENAHFGTNGEKWFVSFTFSFEGYNYEPGWDYTIIQEQDEYLPDFFDRAIEIIDNLLVEADNCDNCPCWIEEEHHGSYLRHGYKGNCRKYGTCQKPGVIKYKWWGENGEVCDNATYHSIVFNYYRTRK